MALFLHFHIMSLLIEKGRRVHILPEDNIAVIDSTYNYMISSNMY